jgi:nitric oxide reductase activation protein
MRETGQVPSWIRQGAPGIRKNRSVTKASRAPAPREGVLGSRMLNLGKELEFDELPHEKVLGFDAREHAKLVAPIRKHVRVLRHYFERLGARTVEDHAQKRGRRIDLARVRRGILERSPHLLVHAREEIAPDLYLGVLIDRSSSMAADQKIEKAKAFAALVTESTKGLRGIRGHVSAFDENTFYRLGDLEHPGIAFLEADGGNNDAGALSKAAELALRSGKQNRLLVMISDGSPTQCTVESLRGLVERLTRLGGFVCAQVAVDEMEEICFPHFVDLSKYPLDEAVGRFGRLLMKLTEAWR